MTNKIYQFELESTRLDLTEKVFPFGILQIKLPRNLRQISYHILSENYCLGMQIFFSESFIQESQLIIGESNFLFHLNGARNDLLSNISKTDAMESKSLTVEFGLFEAAAQNSGTPHLTFWCPFWDSSQSTKQKFEIQVKAIEDRTLTPSLLLELGQQLFEDIDDFRVENIEKKLLEIKGNSETYSTVQFETKELLRSTQISKVTFCEIV